MRRKDESKKSVILDFIDEYIRLPESLVGTGEFFVLIAKGNSMIDAGVNEGDYVVIRKQNTASDAVAKNETVLSLLEESGIADYAIICPKCKQYIGVRRHVGTEMIYREFRSLAPYVRFEYVHVFNWLERLS